MSADFDEEADEVNYDEEEDYGEEQGNGGNETDYDEEEYGTDYGEEEDLYEEEEEEDYGDLYGEEGNIQLSPLTSLPPLPPLPSDISSLGTSSSHLPSSEIPGVPRIPKVTETSTIPTSIEVTTGKVGSSRGRRTKVEKGPMRSRTEYTLQQDPTESNEDFQFRRSYIQKALTKNPLLDKFLLDVLSRCTLDMIKYNVSYGQMDTNIRQFNDFYFP